MGTTTQIGSRRTLAQLHALAAVERDIRTYDNSSRKKYLRTFSRAFRSYQAVLGPDEFRRAVLDAGTILIGDYHALPASQRFAASLLEQRAQPGDRPVVLAVETIFARDQHILDEWWRREIEEPEFRERIRFEVDWGYEWAPFYELLLTAREHGEAIYGIDCTPRDDLRKIRARDRHAAHKLAEIRERHPRAAIFVLFGESHLAPGHLPRSLKQELPDEPVLRILQNVDPLYWQVSSEKENHVAAVRVSSDTICVFNATPLEKYESYRLHLSRWGNGFGDPDLTPTMHNLVESLARFLGIENYSAHNTTQPKFLTDLLPEVCGGRSNVPLSRLLARRGATLEQIEDILDRIEDRGSIYIPQINAIYVREFRIEVAAEDAGRFLHHACRGLPLRADAFTSNAECDFYSDVLEHALAHFSSHALCPVRSKDDDDSEIPPSSFRTIKAPVRRAQWESAARTAGQGLGKSLYAAYVQGRVSRTALRHLFLTHSENKNEAKTAIRRLTTTITTRM